MIEKSKSATKNRQKVRRIIKSNKIYRQKIENVGAHLSNDDFVDVFPFQFFGDEGRQRRRRWGRWNGRGRRPEEPDDPELPVLDRQQVDVVDHLSDFRFSLQKLKQTLPDDDDFSLHFLFWPSWNMKRRNWELLTLLLGTFTSSFGWEL